ncbi:protein FAR1-RELATED SEQUENCE 5-like [Humulus lupulus]|uniref:protein FAR1-RELATED SEQUENCE 5-like n=1 Tax=Humulus lupulus TaxID=3486 RepID=UPI002B40126D|nr:protein FAR1-RELATED SEQUENCE 5-like [Humulus lupulus]
MENKMVTTLAELQIYNKQPHDLSKEDIIGKHLESLDKWEEFFSKYSKWMGFSVRKEDVRHDHENNLWQRKWVCSNQASKRELHFLRSNRAIPESIGAQVMSMRRSGIRTCHIFNHLAQERGGREYVPFLKKDLYNWIGRQRLVQDEEETDAEGALGYLACMGRSDAEFFETHTIDVENRLADLFWADGISRRDYACFGDIMAFDSTYKKNSYNKPLLIFVGLNHHYRTIVFAVALLYDETEETYTWVLEEFLECMKNKPPPVVVTDVDHAMAKAIQKVFPTSVHRLCAWHLQNNVTINAPHHVFKSKFNELLYQY